MRDKSGRMRGACETCKCREYQARDDSPHGGNTGHGASTTTVERDPSGRFAGEATQRCAMCHHSVMVHLAMDLSRARRKARALSARRGKERHAVREGRRTPATARFTAPGGSRLPGPSANAVRAVEARAAAATLGTQEAPPAPPRHEIDLDLFNQLRVKYRNRHCNRSSAQSRQRVRPVNPTWSPAAEYEHSLNNSGPARLRKAGPHNPTLRQAPAFSIGHRTPIYAPASTNPAPNQYGGASTSLSVLSRHKSAPAATMARSKSAAHLPTKETLGPGPVYDVRAKPEEHDGWSFGVRLKSPRTISRDLGHPTTPAPGGNTKVPSFARDNHTAKRGVIMGQRLNTPRTISRNLGYPVPPAPGGNTKVPSFVREAKSENKGVVFGHKLKTAEEIAVACGFPVPPAPGGNVEVLSFAELAIRQGKGVQFGHRLKSQADIDEALGRPSMPGPSAYLLHDLWERNREGLEGPTFGPTSMVRPDLTTGTYMVGHRPNPSYLPAWSQFDEGVRRKKGPSIGTRLKDRREIDAAIGVGPSTTPAPGGNTRVPSFAWEHRDKGVEFGHKLKSPRTILLNIGYPLPPAPGGTYTVPSFAHDNEVAGKGVIFGHKLKSPRTVLQNIGYPMPPAPGGNCVVPSFAAENVQQGKGVPFGTKLPVFPPATYAGPGSYDTNSSFAEENRQHSRGVPFGPTTGPILPTPLRRAVSYGTLATAPTPGAAHADRTTPGARSQTGTF